MKITVYNEDKRKSIEGNLAITMGVENSICSYYRIYPIEFLENGKTKFKGIIEDMPCSPLLSNEIKTGEIIFISNDCTIYRIDKNLLIETGNHTKYLENENYDIYDRNRQIILKNAIPLVKTFMDEYSKSLIDIPESAFQTMSDQVKSSKLERNSHVA